MNEMQQHMEVAKQYLTRYDQCLQAGGAHGVYPLYLAQFFKNVLTCEPYPSTWPILCKAIAGNDKITAKNVALWSESMRGHMVDFRQNKPLTAYVTPGDDFECVKMDSLCVAPELIWLDIQGSEFRALSAGTKTLESCSVVIIEEDGKGLEQRVGSKAGAARGLLLELGFRIAFRGHLDTTFVRV